MKHALIITCGAMLSLFDTVADASIAARSSGPPAIILPARGAPPAVLRTNRPASQARIMPTVPNAPNVGVIASVDAARNDIVISAKHFVIGSPMLALLDKRREATGLLTVATLRSGMQVRYRTETEGGATRIVELWVMRDSPGRESNSK